MAVPLLYPSLEPLTAQSGQGYDDAGSRPAPCFPWRYSVLRWALAFFIIAIIAAVFGFSGIAAGASDIARVCFFFFFVIFLVSLVRGLVTGRRIAPPL